MHNAFKIRSSSLWYIVLPFLNDIISDGRNLISNTGRIFIAFGNAQLICVTSWGGIYKTVKGWKKDPWIIRIFIYKVRKNKIVWNSWLLHCTLLGVLQKIMVHLKVCLPPSPFSLPLLILFCFLHGSFCFWGFFCTWLGQCGQELIVILYWDRLR